MHNNFIRMLLDSVRIYLSLSLLFIVSCTSTSVVQENPQIIREAVMTEGMSIIVQTQYGEFIIKAGKGAERSYTWEGKTLNTVLVPRKKRWHGTLGMLDDNKLSPPHENVIHMVIEECIIHYASFANATNSLSKHSKFEPNIENIYSDDGLFVRFIKREMEIEGKYFVDISVFQILIKGEKPSLLPESQNHKIRVLKL